MAVVLETESFFFRFFGDKIEGDKNKFKIKIKINSSFKNQFQGGERKGSEKLLH